MNEMTHKDPSKRPSANQLIHYPFIAEFWIKNVLNGAIPPLPVGTDSALPRHRSIEYEDHSDEDGEDGNHHDSLLENGPVGPSRPAFHHSDSIQVKSVVQSPEDSGKSGSEGSAESERKRRGSSGSPVYLVTSPCGSPQEVTVPMVPWPHIGRQPEVSINSTAMSQSSRVGG